MSYWSRSFPGLAENLAEVRQFTQMVLGDAPGADLVVLAVSELAGNAIVHTASGAPGGQFVVHLAAFADRWKVRVDDEGSPTVPHVVVDGIDEDAEWDCESGRGLAMVAAISEKWGVLGDDCARAVWAEIPYPVQTTGIDAVMSGGMLDALESVARALDAEDDDGGGAKDDPAYQGIPSPPQVPAARWPGRVPFDPARAERLRQQASHAAFMRALAENAYAETLGPRPLPFWPPFPNPLALQGSSSAGEGQ
ncbi:anti-sigma regulatory factor (Ser/Thr protein kinase) [Catenulispora sp. EB89]|uniref:ATP-binding protein n=1 Tax=Catenulispora sp. EB89 TaxID=3156257 RepID=UPI003510D65C